MMELNNSIIKEIKKRTTKFNSELKRISKEIDKKNLKVKKRVLNALENCIDPEIGINIIDLGFVYNIEIFNKENKYDVKILMTLTSPFCPLYDFFIENIKNEIKKIKEVRNVEVDVTFEPKWNPSMISNEIKKKLGFY